MSNHISGFIDTAPLFSQADTQILKPEGKMQIQNKTIDSRQSSSKLHTERLIELRPFVDDNLR